MNSISFEQLKVAVKSLSTLEKLELIEYLVALLKEELVEGQPQQSPQSSTGSQDRTNASIGDIE
jgi:hypothetical protein